MLGQVQASRTEELPLSFGEGHGCGNAHAQDQPRKLAPSPAPASAQQPPVPHEEVELELGIVVGAEGADRVENRVEGLGLEEDPGEITALAETSTLVLSSQGQSSTKTTMVKAEGHARRPDIDGLRAVCVSAVVLFHIDKAFLPGGFVGVDMFFAISGFVVTASFKHRCEGTWSYLSFLSEFYARRAQRLLPALLATIVLSILLSSWVIPPWAGGSFHFQSAEYGLLGFVNVAYAQKSLDYWAQDLESSGLNVVWNPFIHLWSLGVEEQFYFSYSLLMFVQWAVPGPRAMNVLLTVLALLSYMHTVSLQSSAKTKTWAFFAMSSRFWQLAAGALLCRTEDSWARRLEGKRKISEALSTAAAAMLATALALTPESPGFPHPWALLATTGTLLFIAAGSAGHRPWLNLLLTRPVAVWVGQMSYCIYLVHWPVIVWFRWLNILESTAATLLLPIISLASAAIYYGWEVPLRAWRLRPCLIIALSLLAILVSIGFVELMNVCRDRVYGDALLHNADVPVFEPDQGPGQAGHCSCRLPPEVLEMPQESRLEAWSQLPLTSDPNRPYCFSPRPGRWSLDFHPDTLKPWISADFDHAAHPGDFLRKALHRPPGSSRIFWVIGDSHAERLSVALHLGTNMKIVLVNSGDVAFEFPGEAQDALIDLLQHRLLRPGDIVGCLWLASRILDSDQRVGHFEAFLHRMQNVVVATSTRLALFADNPTMPHIALLCHPDRHGFALRNCTMPRQAVRRERRSLTSVLERAAALPRVSLLDLVHLFCTQTVCSESLPGLHSLVYSDNNHLNDAGAAYLAPFVCAFVDAIST